MKEKKVSTGMKKAADKINSIGEGLSIRSGDNFGGQATIKEGRLTAFGYGVSGPNVHFKGKNKDVKKNLLNATSKSYDSNSW